MGMRLLVCTGLALLTAACAHQPYFETRIDGAATPTAECVARTLGARSDLSVIRQGAMTRYQFRLAAMRGSVRADPERMIYEHRLQPDNRVKNLGATPLETMNAAGRAIDEAIAADC